MLCCGSTQAGQLGLGARETEIYRELVENPYLRQSCRQVAPGVNHTIFLTSEGSVYSCGSNDFEQLGHNKQNRKPQLVDALNGQEHQQVAVGLHFSAALSSNGHVFLFGSISGDPSKQDKFYFNKPTRIKSFQQKIVQIACGYHHILTLAQDSVVSSLGTNVSGQLGIGSKDSITSPTKLISFQGMPIYHLACGSFHSVVITVSGNVFTFGSNSFGQLGISGNTNQSWPQHVKQLQGQRPRYAACGESHTAIVTCDGGVFTFGAGSYGQLGHSSANHESLPRKVFELMGASVSMISCGRYHTLAYVPSIGRLYAFGLNSKGQLGIRSGDVIKTPLAIESRWSANGKKSNSRFTLHNSVAASNKDRDTRHSQPPILIGIFAGGDSTFVKVSLSGRAPYDYRKFNSKQTIPSITLDTARNLALINAKSKSHISPDDVRTIEILFRSESCINASFLLMDHDAHMNTSLQNAGVDIKQAIDVFEKIRSVNSVVQSLLIYNISKMLNELSRFPTGVESLRVFVVLPFCHLFEDSNLLAEINYPFTKAVNDLSPFASGVIDSWFCEASTTFFDRALHVFKPMVMHILKLPQISENEQVHKYRTMLRSTLDFLARLHRINSSVSDGITCYDSFYITELSEIIDVQYDYIEYINRNASTRGKDQSNGPITFCDYPFVFDGLAKCKLLQLDARLKQQIACNNAIGTSMANLLGLGGVPQLPDLRLLITRSRLLHDTIDQLKFCAHDDLKKPLTVIFIGEEGIDGGGVKKEFFLLLMRELLDPKYGMFVYFAETRCIWFNEFSFEEEDMYNLVGKICALAIYNETIIDLPFPLILYKKILDDSRLSLDDLKDLDLVTYRSLCSMLDYDGDDFEEVFSVSMSIDKNVFGQVNTIDLVPNGRDIKVTRENINEYIQAYVEHVLSTSVNRQFAPFYDGFHQVMSSSILRMFQPAELMTMVIGTQNYDLDLIQEYVQYEGVFYADHQVIKWFWEVVREFSVIQMKQFLLFLTGSDRLPMVGLGSFKIIIHPTHGGDQYFPVAHTCFNRLDLPIYGSKALLKEKLTIAIQHDKGFTLA